MGDSARKKEGSQVTVQLSRIQQRRAIALYLLSPDPRFFVPTAKMYRTVPRMAGYVNIDPCACLHATCPRCGCAVGFHFAAREGVRDRSIALTPLRTALTPPGP